jgi:hypothetical protein
VPTVPRQLAGQVQPQQRRDPGDRRGEHQPDALALDLGEPVGQQRRGEQESLVGERAGRVVGDGDVVRVEQHPPQDRLGDGLAEEVDGQRPRRRRPPRRRGGLHGR